MQNCCIFSLRSFSALLINDSLVRYETIALYSLYTKLWKWGGVGYQVQSIVTFLLASLKMTGNVGIAYPIIAHKKKTYRSWRNILQPGKMTPILCQKWNKWDCCTSDLVGFSVGVMATAHSGVRWIRLCLNSRSVSLDIKCIFSQVHISALHTTVLLNPWVI